MILHDGYKSTDKFEEVLKNIKSPLMKYAPYVFWFFDQSPDTLGIKAQEMAHELNLRGFNPGYAHARVNYAYEAEPENKAIKPIQKSEWLSEEWFSLFKEQLLQAEEDGTHFSFTDDFDWPSLQAAGRIVEKDPSLKAKSLWYKYVELAKGETVDIKDCFFSVAGKLEKTEQTSYVKLYDSEENGWKRPQYYCDQTPPDKAHTVPFNMASAFTDNLSLKAEYNFNILNGGKYTLFATWQDQGNNTACAEYIIGEKSVTADQRNNPYVWNKLGEFDLKTGINTVTVRNADKGILSVDAIKLVAESGEEYILDELYVFDRKIGFLDIDSLEVLSGESFTAPYDCRVYIFTLGEHRGYDSSTANYLDNRLSDLFFDEAWVPYFEQCSDFLGSGKTLNGIFSDHEGDYGYKLGWSDDLKELFFEKYGEDIRRILPLMIDRDVSGKYAMWRYRWFDTVSDIYVKHFHKLSNIAAEKDLYYTFHTWEESLPLQALCVGDVFKLNRGISLPGTDALHNVCFNPQNFKDIFSICEFEGLRMMDEVMALIDLEDYNPDILKTQANYLALYGVSHVINHSVKMTRRLAQNFVAPDFYNIDPCWNAMNEYTSFLRRTSYINSLGKSEANVLIVNPLDSMYVLAENEAFTMDFIFLGMHHIGAAFGGEAAEIDRQYGKLIRHLTKNRVEFLSADKEYISRMTVADSALSYKDYSFETVVLPRSVAIDLRVAKKLEEFALGGGKLVVIGDFPTVSLQNGTNDTELVALKERFKKLSNAEFVALPDEVDVCSGISFEEDAGILANRRLIDGRHFIFLCNNSNEEVNTVLNINCQGENVFILNPTDASRVTPQWKKENNNTVVSLKFAPLEAYYLVIDPIQSENEVSAVKKLIKSVEPLKFTASVCRGEDALAPEIRFPRLETEALRVILRKGSFKNPTEITVKRVDVLNGNEVVYSKDFGKTYTVVFDEVIGLELDFELQSVDGVRIVTENGITSYRIETKTEKWWKTVAQEDYYCQNETIKPINYPLDEYAVELDSWGNWEFLPDNFAGIITYKTVITLKEEDITGNATLSLEKFCGGADITVNGEKTNTKMFAPFDYQIGHLLKKGENDIYINVSNTIHSNISHTKGGISGVKLNIYE